MTLENIKGLGPKNLQLINKLGIYTIDDLINFYPFRYDVIERSNVDELNDGDKIIIDGIIESVPSIFYFGKRRDKMSFKLNTGENIFRVDIYNRGFLKSKLKIGTNITVIGKIDKKHNLIIVSDISFGAILKTKIEPVYHTTYGIGITTIKKYINSIIDNYHTKSLLPDYLIDKYKLMDKDEAIKIVHNPTKLNELNKALNRLRYEELFLFMCKMNYLKNNIQYKEGLKRVVDKSKVYELINNLEFKLTDDQLKAVEDIYNDLTLPYRMNRLLQGDVGSGKTIVSFISLFINYLGGYQGALMAPTEVLAVQHYEMLCNMTKQYGLAFRPTLLVGSQTAKQKREIYEKIANGSLNVVIGTHAVIQDKVMFKNLALVITDEQHRFGVRQRETLSGKGNGAAHTIVMSATPIPRSLAIILYGDMEVTQLRELPAKRLPIKNCVVNQSYRQTAYRFMQKEVDAGHQVYIVCPMAEPGVMDELENVVDYSKTIQAFFSPQTRIAYLHGKMRPKLKNEIMTRFAAGEIDVLVSTTVIEVGINVPNATVMMVENAERFGLATLHQIRGRVGRSDLQSYCIFMESAEKKKQNERLAILNRSNDGFEIANADLKLRGPGDFMGIQQSGAFAFRFADVYQDSALLMDAAADAAKILKSNSLLLSDSHLPLKRKLESYQTHGYLHVL